jgi:hypothetical protein
MVVVAGGAAFGTEVAVVAVVAVVLEIGDVVDADGLADMVADCSLAAAGAAGHADDIRPRLWLGSLL